MSDLKTVEGVVKLMKSSRNESEWDQNCDSVKAANDGYPKFWFLEIILSGVLQTAQDSWK